MTAGHFQHVCACAIAILIAAPISFARAAPSTDAAKTLQQGVIAYNSGKTETALTHLTAVIQSDKRSLKDLAKALHYRAKAYFALKKPGLAIADVNSALWLKQLSPLAREDAVRLKQRALQTTGVIPASAPADKPTPARRQQQVAVQSPNTTGSIAPRVPQKAWATTAVATQAKPKPVISRIQTAAATPQSPVAPAWTTSAKISRAPKIPTTVKTTALKPLAPATATARVATRPYAAKPTMPALRVAKAPSTPAPAPAPISSSWPTAVTQKSHESAPKTTGPQSTKGTWATKQTVAPKRTPSLQPQQVAVAKPMTSSPPSVPEPNSDTDSAGLFSLTPAVSGILELTGLQETPTPMKSSLHAAEELAKRRSERIRQHNKMYAAGQTAIQSVDQRVESATP